MSSDVAPLCGWPGGLAGPASKIGRAWRYLLVVLALATPALAQDADPFLSAPSRPHTVTPRPPQPAPQPGTPEAFLAQGTAALRRQDYAAAEAAAREVLKVRHAPRAVDAHFLLAQAFAGRQDYGHAADAYGDAYDDARTGPRAQDALLAMANAYATLGKNRGACNALEKLKKEFPAPRADLVASINAVRQRATCH